MRVIFLRIYLLLFQVVCLLHQWSVAHRLDRIHGDIYKIGFGISDITGPAAEINMMGYAKVTQDTRGIHTRLYSRAMVILDETGSRVCYVNVDLCSSTQIVKLMVIEKLENIFGKGLYTHENVLISATHTHAGPGGYFQYLLYIITTEGFIKDSMVTIVTGIVKSITDAHKNLVPGRISYAEDMLTDASINRSPASYLNNPESERAKYKYNTDKMMQLLKFTDLDDKPLGIVNWFPVHLVSMNNTNKLISSDNKGYAAIKFEQDFNGFLPIGKGPFVAIFGQSNEGDSSPNTKGPRCLDTGLPCDFVHSTCRGQNDLCVAFGPGKDMFESTKIIGEKQYNKAKELFEKAKSGVRGSVHYVYQNINMTKRAVKLENGTEVETCAAALGFSFAAGTTDGEGGIFFQQGTKHGQESLLWDFLRNVIKTPSEEIVKCQYPKAILLPVGEMNFPYEWTPEVMPTQILEIGNIVIVGLPGEFTTMAGRRIRSDVAKIYAAHNRQVHVILAGLANTYSNYIATIEEYQLQRYEGGSTLFGPYTLDAYREQYRFLANQLVVRTPVASGAPFPNLLSQEITLKPGVIFDMPLTEHFGEVLTEPFDSYYVGTRVKVRFCGANPRNNMRLEDTFLTVERLEDQRWEVVATDANWETMFIWHRNSTLLGTSEVTVLWDIPLHTKPGTYRIRYFGDRKSILQNIQEFTGTSKPFKVTLLEL